MSEPPPLQQINRTQVLHRGRKLIYFGGCDYFRLASHPRVLGAVREGLRRFGLNVAASRLTTGNHTVYGALERDLARFFGVQAALLASNGYVPNLMVCQALAGEFSHALLDERAHGCLVDAALMLDCPVVRFKHRDALDLNRVVQRLGRQIKPLLLTDGLFSHDGSVAPLKDYLHSLPARAMMLVDDAHGAGVLGRNRRGTPEYAGISRARVIQTITLSKAFGVYGGAVLTSRQIARQIAKRSRLFVGSTPLPLPLAHAARESLRIVRADRSLGRRLDGNVRYAKQALRKAGHPVEDSPAPLIAAIPASDGQAARLKQRLLARGVFPSFIHYPGGPKDGYFRFALSSEHRRAELDALLAALLE